MPSRLGIAVCLASGIARPAFADAASECYATASAEKPTPPGKLEALGCFERVRATEDHAYGHALCLFVADGKCSGILYHYDANPEPDWALLDEVTCGTKDGAVSFRVSRKFKVTFTDVGPVDYRASFSGRIVKGALRGTLQEPPAGSARVTWKRRRGGLATAEHAGRRWALEQTAACLAR